MEKTNIFKCKPPEVHFTIRDRVPYNKLLTNLACLSCTVEYWPSRSVSKRLICLFISIELTFGRIPEVILIMGIHPQQGQNTHWELHALLFLNSVWFFNVMQNCEQCRVARGDLQFIVLIQEH